MVRSVRRYACLFLGVALAVAWLSPTAKAKEPNPIVQLAKKLAEPVDFPGFEVDPKMTLREALEFLTKQYGVTFDVNEKAFQQIVAGVVKAPRLGGHDVSLVAADTKPEPDNKGVKPPPPPAPAAAQASNDVLDSLIVPTKPIRKMTHVRLETVLKKILANVKDFEVTYVLRRDGIEITTPEFKLREFYNQEERPLDMTLDVQPGQDHFRYLPLVQAEFDKKPLEEAFKELADATDWTIVLDARAAEKAKPVTASLINVPLDTAVELLANMSGLTVVPRDKALYVTTKETAVAMHKEMKERVAPPPPGGVPPGGIGPGVPPGGIGPGVPPGGIGPGGLPGGAPLVPPLPPEVKKTAPADPVKTPADQAQRRRSRREPNQDK